MFEKIRYYLKIRNISVTHRVKYYKMKHKMFKQIVMKIQYIKAFVLYLKQFLE